MGGIRFILLTLLCGLLFLGCPQAEAKKKFGTPTFSFSILQALPTPGLPYRLDLSPNYTAAFSLLQPSNATQSPILSEIISQSNALSFSGSANLSVFPQVAELSVDWLNPTNPLVYIISNSTAFPDPVVYKYEGLVASDVLISPQVPSALRDGVVWSATGMGYFLDLMGTTLYAVNISTSPLKISGSVGNITGQTCANTGFLLLDPNRAKMYILYTDNITRIDLNTFQQDAVLNFPRTKDANVCQSQKSKESWSQGPHVLSHGFKNHKRQTTSSLVILVGCPVPAIPSVCQDAPFLLQIDLDTFTFATSPVSLPQYNPTSSGFILGGPRFISSLVNDEFALLYPHPTSGSYKSIISAVNVTDGSTVQGGYKDSTNTLWSLFPYHLEGSTGVEYYGVTNGTVNGEAMWRVNISIE